MLGYYFLNVFRVLTMVNVDYPCISFDFFSYIYILTGNAWFNSFSL